MATSSYSGAGRNAGEVDPRRHAAWRAALEATLDPRRHTRVELWTQRLRGTTDGLFAALERVDVAALLPDALPRPDYVRIGPGEWIEWGAADDSWRGRLDVRPATTLLAHVRVVDATMRVWTTGVPEALPAASRLVPSMRRAIQALGALADGR